jgi:hypothetical protein
MKLREASLRMTAFVEFEGRTSKGNRKSKGKSRGTWQVLGVFSLWFGLSGAVPLLYCAWVEGNFRQCFALDRVAWFV